MYNDRLVKEKIEKIKATISVLGDSNPDLVRSLEDEIQRIKYIDCPSSWVIRYENGDTLIRSDIYQNPICHIFKESIFYKMNTTLIKHAPDMFNLLNRLLKYKKANLDLYDVFNDVETIINKIREE